LPFFLAERLTSDFPPTTPAPAQAALHSSYAASYPDCDYILAGINRDGAVDGYDIDPFVLLLTGGRQMCN
jgi:hypothetical protein